MYKVLSLVDMVSKMISSVCVVAVGRVVNVLSVSVRVGIGVLDFEVCIVGEEKTIPCSLFLIMSILLITEGLIVCFESSALCDIEILLGDHGGEGTEVSALVPGIHSLASVC